MKRIGIRDIGNAALYRGERALLRLRLFLQLRLGFVKRYQPNPFQTFDRQCSVDRACEDRFRAISAMLPLDEPLTCMDIGCNLGYFVFRMSERGGLCIGLDRGRNEISVARGLAALHKVRNVLFTEFEVTAESARTLPEVDAVICLSVFHHWARNQGLDQAKRIMAGVASRARRYLVFETGQRDETEARWAADLVFMGNDCDQWIRGFLTDLGFDAVSLAGRFPSPVSSGVRNLYVASRGVP